MTQGLSLPDPNEPHPIVLPGGERHRGTVFLKPVVDHPNFRVGAYTYAHDDTLPEDFAAQLAPYLFPGAPETLTIGRFCQIAQGVRFITGSANHPMHGLSTFPFAAFDPARIEALRSAHSPADDITVGHDCWIGRDAMVLPGARLGNGVIVGARAVVSGDVPDYAVVAGNPARVIRRRFDDSVIARLRALAWWDWPADRIAGAMLLIEEGDIDGLERFHGADGPEQA